MSERTDRDDPANPKSSDMTTAETGAAAPPPDADHAADPGVLGPSEPPEPLEPPEPERRAPRVRAVRAAASATARHARRPPNALGPFITGGGQ
jgi:hypothetical protein